MIWAVLRKDLVSTWVTPMPYVVGAALQAVLGLLMVNQLQVRDQAVIQPLFPLAGFLLLLVVPLVTMRTFADEARHGTLDLLLAVPVPIGRLVVGKWLAAWFTSLVLLAPASVFVALLALWGSPDTGPALSGFLGLSLLTAALAAMSTLTSSLTVSQPVAAMSAIFGALVLWFVHLGNQAVDTGSLLRSVSFSERLRLFAGGAIDTGDLVYFAAVTVGALVLTTAAIELRSPRGAR